MASTQVAEQILKDQSNIKDWQEELYKDIHSHPELSFRKGARRQSWPRNSLNSASRSTRR